VGLLTGTAGLSEDESHGQATYYDAPSVKTDDAEIVANITAICDESLSVKDCQCQSVPGDWFSGSLARDVRLAAPSPLISHSTLR
jgi:hypothetical protein